MRTAFISTLVELAETDKNIFLLAGDLGFSVFEKFQTKFPDRFYNMGVAESNMIGVAAGLSLSGKKVFVYSIVPFVTMRCFEQIRNDVCLQNLDVKIVGVGGGLCYGSAGSSHHALEDIAIMRSLLNMTVVCPADPIETKLITKHAITSRGPMYIRLSKSSDPLVYVNPPELTIGKGIIIEDGKDITIIATGNMVWTVKEGVKILKASSISTRLISMHTIKPIDKELILDSADKTKIIFTVEEHNIIGGLGSAVAEILTEAYCKTPLDKIGVRDPYLKEIGSHEYLRQKIGLIPEKIAERIIGIWRNKEF